MRGDIAIESMITIMIAIIAAGLLISLAFGRLPELALSLSCSAHSLMNSLIPSGDLEPSLPEYCKPETRETKKIGMDKNRTAEEIAAYILDCWEKGERGGVGETFQCNQFAIDYDENFVIDRDDIIQVFIDNDLCTSSGIMDNTTGCGSLSQIQWNKTDFKNKDFVLLEYTPGKVLVR
jgi:hypothetical protein